jgi:hypothetical protein
MKAATAPVPFNRSVHAVSILSAAAPFAFAAIRAVTTGNDFRYVWGALAAFCGAAAVMALARARGRTANTAVALHSAGTSLGLFNLAANGAIAQVDRMLRAVAGRALRPDQRLHGGRRRARSRCCSRGMSRSPRTSEVGRRRQRHAHLLGRITALQCSSA